MSDKKKKPDFRKWSNKYLSSSEGLPPFSKGGIGEGKKLFCNVCLERVGSAKAYIDKFDDVVYCCEDCRLSDYYDMLSKTKIVFDLDGVIRDLNLYLANKYQIPYPQEWFWTHEGKDIYQWAEEDKLEILLNSPTTEYINIIKEYFGNAIEIWTCQPTAWRPFTLKWLQNNFPETKVKVDFLNGKEKRLRLDSEPNTFLVEDSPQFEDYKRIILIDRPYNKNNLNVPMRINNEKEIERFFRKVRASQT
jgi:hypothetical protein